MKKMNERQSTVSVNSAKVNLNERPHAGIDLCDYVILNGKNANWNNVFNTIKDMKIDGEHNADIAVLLNKIEQGVYGITLEDNVCEVMYIMVIGWFMQLRGMLIEIREFNLDKWVDGEEVETGFGDKYWTDSECEEE